MFHMFHKWTKWTEPLKGFQERHCMICNKYDKRRVWYVGW